MPDASWKSYERTVSMLFHGKRRGAYTGANGQGKSDIIKTGWAIECKLLSRIGWQDCLDAVAQAKANTEKPDDIAVAVIKRKGDHYDHCLVVMELHDFVERFVNEEV
jgi:hypothetical protein